MPQNDSTYFDTIPLQETEQSIQDTSISLNVSAPTADSVITTIDTVPVVNTKPAPPVEKVTSNEPVKSKPVKTEPIITKPAQAETNHVVVPEVHSFKLFNASESIDSSLVQPQNTAFSNFVVHETKAWGVEKAINKSYKNQYGWLLSLSIMISVLLIIVRLAYQKYLPLVLTSLVNFQLSEKLFREKNVMVRRVFFMLNLNFIIAFALFAYLLATRYKLIANTENDLLLFVYLVLLLAGIYIIKFVLLKLTAFIFDANDVFNEYNYNNQIINKNLGLYLIPLVLSAFFVNVWLKDIFIYISSFMLIVGVLYKYIRSVRIIIKHNVFLFYSFLYLCTLEILPIIIGVKFVISLV